jgi:hypothetical protein
MYTKTDRKANWLTTFPVFFFFWLGDVARVRFCSEDLEWASSRSDDEASGGYAHHYTSSYERNFVLRMFLKRRRTVFGFSAQQNTDALSLATTSISGNQRGCYSAGHGRTILSESRLDKHGVHPLLLVSLPFNTAFSLVPAPCCGNIRCIFLQDYFVVCFLSFIFTVKLKATPVIVEQACSCFVGCHGIRLRIATQTDLL